MHQTCLVLRRWWLGFALLILAGLVSQLFFSPYASAWQQYHLRPRRFWFTLGHAALFGLMVAATYARQKLLWWAAVVIISLKLYRLLKYYALFNYLESSNVYHRDYTLLLYHLRDVAPWLWLPSELFFGNHALSAALLTTLYVYWLTLCRRVIQPEPTGKQSLVT
jgi:hypothetical protein